MIPRPATQSKVARAPAKPVAGCISFEARGRGHSLLSDPAAPPPFFTNRETRETRERVGLVSSFPVFLVFLGSIPPRVVRDGAVPQPAEQPNNRVTAGKDRRGAVDAPGSRTPRTPPHSDAGGASGPEGRRAAIASVADRRRRNPPRGGANISLLADARRASHRAAWEPSTGEGVQREPERAHRARRHGQSRRNR